MAIRIQHIFALGLSLLLGTAALVAHSNDYIVGAHEQRSRRTRWRGYEAAESRNTYSAAIFPSRTMTTSKPV